MGYRYVFNLQQRLLLMAVVHLSVYGTNGCFSGGIFFIKPGKREERCWIYFWDTENKMEDTHQWSSLSGHKDLWEIFVTAVCLHNMIVDDTIMNYKDARVGRGSPLNNGGMYLGRHTVPPNIDKQDKHLVKKFGKRWLNLAIHLWVMREKGPIPSNWFHWYQVIGNN